MLAASAEPGMGTVEADESRGMFLFCALLRLATIFLSTASSPTVLCRTVSLGCLALEVQSEHWHRAFVLFVG